MSGHYDSRGEELEKEKEQSFHHAFGHGFSV
jgi:hypothetical protein